MTTPSGHLLHDLPVAPLPEEVFTTLARSGPVRMERIVSTGQATPEGVWYDQAWDEFVLLVSGAATLEIAGLPPRDLAPGEWIMLPAHTRHRVARTADGQPTVWLAVHVGEPER